MLCEDLKLMLDKVRKFRVDICPGFQDIKKTSGVYPTPLNQHGGL